MPMKYSGDNLQFPDNSIQNTAPSGFGFKNRIINGAMTVAQRGTSFSGLTSSQYCLDRFSVDIGGGGAITVVQSSQTPAGFTSSLGLTVATADSSIGSGDAYRVSQMIEGLNTYDLNWGSAVAAPVTLSFWVRSSVTGTFGLGISNSAETENYVATYTINAANTWEQKTVTIAGDTTGTWLTTNGIGIGLRFDLGSGTNYNGTASTWQTTAGKVYRTNGCVNWIATAGATFYITGVQLEKGSTATSFDYRPYGTELALCQRYYYRNQGGEPYGRYGLAVAGASTNAKLCMNLPVTMRASSTTIDYGGTIGLYNGGSVITITTFTADVITKFVATLNCSVASGLTSGGAYEVTNNNSSTAYIGISAEL